jgi:hypothetical protein
LLRNHIFNEISDITNGVNHFEALSITAWTTLDVLLLVYGRVIGVHQHPPSEFYEIILLSCKINIIVDMLYW